MKNLLLLLLLLPALAAAKVPDEEDIQNTVSIFLSIVFSKDPKSISEILLLPIGIVSMLLVEHSVICHTLASCEVCTVD